MVEDIDSIEVKERIKELEMSQNTIESNVMEIKETMKDFLKDYSELKISSALVKERVNELKQRVDETESDILNNRKIWETRLENMEKRINEDLKSNRTLSINNKVELAKMSVPAGIAALITYFLTKGP